MPFKRSKGSHAAYYIVYVNAVYTLVAMHRNV